MKPDSQPSAYMQMIYIDADGNARHTGVGAAMNSDADTRRAFEALRRLSVDFDEAAFLLDLHEANGDLVDTLAIRKKDFPAITGEAVKSDVDYRRIDQQYWAKAQREHAKAA
jgi:hypothetical protein